MITELDRKSSYNKDYYNKHKDKIKEYQRLYRLKNKKEIKKYHSKYYNKNKIKYSIKNTKNRLQREYGMTIEEYAALLKQQNNRCAICRTDKCKSGNTFCVDHNHTTGKVRGLVCINCNTLLGHAHDNTKILEKAITYLKGKK